MDEYLETKLSKGNSNTEIAKVCISLLCTPGSWSDYATALETGAGAHSNRHLLLYLAVFWPWHFSRPGVGDDILTGLWDTFISQTNYESRSRYHRLQVKESYSSDLFWQRVRKFQHVRFDNRPSCISVFALDRQFTVVFELGSYGAQQYMDKLLYRVCRFGDLQIARLLIERGADVKAADHVEETPLHLASGRGHEAVARLLIERGADVKAAAPGFKGRARCGGPAAHQEGS